MIDPSVLVAALRAVIPTISTDETRVHLNSLLLETVRNDTQLRLVATDGHRLVAVDVDASIDRGGSVMLPLSAVKRLVRDVTVPRKRGALVDVELCASPDARSLTVTQGPLMGATHACADPGVYKFPTYRDVIPTAFAGHIARPSISARYLSEAADVFAELTDRSDAVQVSVGASELDPIVMTSPAYDRAVVVVMPMRAGENHNPGTVTNRFRESATDAILASAAE
jgi:DNA polymerase III sliding clamp (beta) subunit (PCNA family)